MPGTDMSEIGADVVSPRVACLTEGYLLPFVLSPTKKSQTNAHKQKNINHQTKVPGEMSWWRFLLSSELFPARKTQTERAKRKKLKISNKQGVFLWNWLAISTSKMKKQRVRPIQGGMSDLEGYLVPSQLSSTWKSQQTSSLYLGQQLEQTGRENRQVPSAIVSFLQLF